MRFRLAPLLILALLAGCQPAPPVPVAPADPHGFAGSYRKGAEWLDIGPAGDDYWVSIDSAGHRDGCLFVARATRDNDGLEISLEAWRPGARLLLQHAGHGLIDVRPDDDDDAFDPAYFCRGGATLAGRYSPITPPAYRRGHIEQDNGDIQFRPCGSRLTYLLATPPGEAPPVSTEPVELSVTVAAAKDLAGHAGRYTVATAPPTPVDPPDDCPNAAPERK